MATSIFAPTYGETREDVSTPFRHIDWGLMLVTLAIAGFGMVAIYGVKFATTVKAGGDPGYLVKRQAIALAVGLMVMFTLMLIDYRWLASKAWIFFAGSAVLLVGLFVTGKTKFGATAWYRIGSFQLQPSEFAKVALVLMLAAVCSDDRGEALPFERFVGALFLLAIPLGLVLLQPDLGTGSTLVAVTMGILLIARARARHILLISAMALITAVAVVSTGQLQTYQLNRLVSFIDQKETATNKDLIQQVKYSKQAISLGRTTGAGYKQGLTTTGKYIPFQENDFIFSAVGEQFGLVGAGGLLLLYLFVLLRLLRIVQMARDHLGALIAAGAAALLAWHVFENVGMTMGIMPVTGIPLPLVSYGGSSLIAFLAVFGLVQNVHMRRYHAG